MKIHLFKAAPMTALLYALAGCSNPQGNLAGLATGTMAKLEIDRSPAPAPTTPFHDAAGATRRIGDFAGKVAVVNLWANWCVPCKAEIPSLAKLQSAYAGKPLAVVPINVGKDEDERAGRAFIEKNPPLVFYTEPTYALAFAFKPPVAAMPTTLIFDKHGRERARLAGGADWSSAQARRVIDALLAER